MLPKRLSSCLVASFLSVVLLFPSCLRADYDKDETLLSFVCKKDGCLTTANDGYFMVMQLCLDSTLDVEYLRISQTKGIDAYIDRIPMADGNDRKIRVKDSFRSFVKYNLRQGNKEAFGRLMAHYISGDFMGAIADYDDFCHMADSISVQATGGNEKFFASILLPPMRCTACMAVANSYYMLGDYVSALRTYEAGEAMFVSTSKNKYLKVMESLTFFSSLGKARCYFRKAELEPDNEALQDYVKAVKAYADARVLVHPGKNEDQDYRAVLTIETAEVVAEMSRCCSGDQVLGFLGKSLSISDGLFKWPTPMNSVLPLGTRLDERVRILIALTSATRGDVRAGYMKESDELMAHELNEFEKGKGARKEFGTYNTYSNLLCLKARIGSDAQFVDTMEKAVDAQRKYLACVNDDSDPHCRSWRGMRDLGVELSVLANRLHNERSESMFDEAMKSFDSATNDLGTGRHNAYNVVEVSLAKADALRLRAEVCADPAKRAQYLADALALCAEVQKSCTLDTFRQNWAISRGIQARVWRMQAEALQGDARNALLASAVAAMKERQSIRAEEFDVAEFDACQKWLAAGSPTP